MRRLSLAVWLVIGLGLALLCSRADLGSTMDALLPNEHSELGRNLRFFAQQRAAQLLALEAWAIDDHADPTQVLRDIGETLRPHGLRPLGTNDPQRFAELGRVLDEHLPALLPADAWDAIAARSHGEGLRQHLAALRQRASDPSDVFTATAAQDDILGLSGFVLLPLSQELGSAAASDGVIVHADGRHHLLLAEVAFPPGDSARTHDLMQAVDVAVAQARRQGVQVEAIGSHRHFRDNLDGIRNDLLTSLPLGMVLIAIILFTLVRSLRAVFALHVPALLAALGAVALLVALGQPVPVLLIGFAAGFLGVSIENALHMTTALQRGQAAHVRRPLVVSYLTTAVAFAVLLASGIPALRSLGIMVMGGLIFALVSSLLLLPHLVEVQSGPAPWPRATRWLLAVTRIPATRRLALLAVISVAALPGLVHLRVIDDLRRLDGSRPETVATLTDFLTRWDRFEASDFLVAEGESIDIAMSRFTAARRHIASPPTLVDMLLPPQAEQTRRWQAWNNFWSEHGPRFDQDLRAALGERGYAATQASRTRYQVRSHQPAPVTLDTWRATPFADLLDQCVTTHADGVTVAAPLADARDAARVTAAADLLRDDPHVRIASRGRLAVDLVALVKHDLLRLCGWMALAMVVLVVVLERVPRIVVAILVPPTLALAWAFGLMGWLGVPLTPFSVMVAAFVAGIGLDNAVFLARPRHREQALAPVLACTVTTMIGVGSLMVAQNPILQQNGIALTIGLACCLVACLLLTPILMPEETTTS